MIPAGLCWLSPGSSTPGTEHTISHSSATKPARNPCQDPSLHIPHCSAPSPLQVLLRLFIDGFIEGTGASHLLHIPTRIQRGGEGRREPELDPVCSGRHRETAEVYKYLQRQRLRRGREVIHSPGAVKIGSQGVGWGSWEALGEQPGLGELPGGSGLPARGAEPFPGCDTRAAEGLKCLKPRVLTGTECRLCTGTMPSQTPSPGAGSCQCHLPGTVPGAAEEGKGSVLHHRPQILAQRDRDTWCAGW